MNVVITMGGMGSRFKAAGYVVPKYEIEVHGKTLFDWSMLSLKAFWKERFFFIVRKEDNANNFICSHCKALGILPEVIEIDYLTHGQAETALLAQDRWNKREAVFIYNIDTYVEPGYMRADLIEGAGFIPCFSAPGNHWSFVRVGENNLAVEVREKEKISDNCSIGAYYFESADLYEKIYKDFYGNNENMEKGERYIAPMYNYMIERGYKVRIQNIPAERVHVLGTPEELHDFEKT